MPDLTSLYHRLPYFPFKMAAASVRGSQLRRWRYGRETDGQVVRALERDRWPSARLEEWQGKRVRELLERVSRDVPFYRRLMANWGQKTAESPFELNAWPVLTKDQVRESGVAFVAEGADYKAMFTLNTSGSSGTPLRLWITRRDLRAWYALFEARWRNWHGVNRRDRWAILGGQMVTRPGRSRPPFWVWNQSMRQLYLSSYHISEKTVGHYLYAMKNHRITYLYGYPSAMYDLSRRALDVGLQGPSLKVVLSNAEPLFDHQREAMTRLFGCPVRNTYGMAEMVCGAGECEHSTMHLWPEAGLVEVLDDNDRPVPRGEVGRLVCTGLVNTDMPLIRYEVGDRGALAPEDESCPCGRTLPILKAIEGRLDDVVVTPDGRKIGRLDTVFKADLPIRAAQIIQNEPGRLYVRVVVDVGFSDDTEKEVARRLRDRVGDMEIQTEQIDRIPLGPNGKFRAVINRIQ